MGAVWVMGLVAGLERHSSGCGRRVERRLLENALGFSSADPGPPTAAITKKHEQPEP